MYRFPEILLLDLCYHLLLDQICYHLLLALFFGYIVKAPTKRHSEVWGARGAKGKVGIRGRRHTLWIPPICFVWISHAFLRRHESAPSKSGASGILAPRTVGGRVSPSDGTMAPSMSPPGAIQL